MMARKMTPPGEQQRIALRIHTAYDMLARRGDAGVEEWRDLCDCINMVESLCDLAKMDPELHMAAITESVGAMAEAMEAFGEVGRMRLSDRGLEAMGWVMSAYDLAVGRFSQKTLVEAQAHFVLKVARAKEKPDPTVRVVTP